jgi:hypothetical protein
LPFGGDLELDQVREMGIELARRVVDARERQGPITWDKPATARWIDVYGELSGEHPGLVGAVTARAEAQVVRLAVTYALLDGAKLIGLPHLEAALAFWAYSARSAEWAFGDSTGDPIADTIVDALRTTGETGMSRSEIRDMLGRNLPSERIESALVVLIVRGLARMEMEQTGGRPLERWFPIGGRS